MRCSTAKVFLEERERKGDDKDVERRKHRISKLEFAEIQQGFCHLRSKSAAIVETTWRHLLIRWITLSHQFIFSPPSDKA